MVFSSLRKSFSVDPETSALVVNDVQAGFMSSKSLYGIQNFLYRDDYHTPNGSRHTEKICERIARLTEFLRAQDIPIIRIYVDPTGIGPDLSCGGLHKVRIDEERDILVPKSSEDAFQSSDLELKLAMQGITTLLFTGGYTGRCIKKTVISALDRSFKVAVLKDCVTDGNGMHTEMREPLSDMKAAGARIIHSKQLCF